jgi:hypothetical protein
MTMSKTATSETYMPAFLPRTRRAHTYESPSNEFPYSLSAGPGTRRTPPTRDGVPLVSVLWLSAPSPLRCPGASPGTQPGGLPGPLGARRSCAPALPATRRSGRSLRCGCRWRCSCRYLTRLSRPSQAFPRKTWTMATICQPMRMQRMRLTPPPPDARRCARPAWRCAWRPCAPCREPGRSTGSHARPDRRGTSGRSSWWFDSWGSPYSCCVVVSTLSRGSTRRPEDRPSSWHGPGQRCRPGPWRCRSGRRW